MSFLRIVKRATIVVLIVIACFVTVGFLAGIFYEKEAKQLVISELNKHLSSRVEVGTFHFSLLSHFPYASIDMEDVVVGISGKEDSKDSLLYAKKISLLLNLTAFFKKEVTLRKIVMDDGRLMIKVEKDGTVNYRFWKKGEDTAESGALDIKKIVLKSVYVTYDDAQTDQQYALMASDAELSGRFSTNEFSLKTKAKLAVDHLLIHGINYVDHKTVQINTALKVNSEKGTYEFEKSNIAIADVDFKVSGKIMEKPDWALDLDIDAGESTIANFASVLPKEFTSYISNYKSAGKLALTATVTGNVGGRNVPEVNLKFAMRNGSLAAADGTKLEQLNFTGTFQNARGKKVSNLDIPALSASLSGHPIQASLRFENLNDPTLNLKARSQLNLTKLLPFLQADTIESLSGDLALNISYTGKLKDLTEKNQKLGRVKASGNVDISHVYFRLKNNPLEFRDLNGNFLLKNSDLIVENISGSVSSTDFRLNGVFRNFLPFLLVPGESGNMQATLTSNNINLDELLVNKSSVNKGDTSYIMRFNPRLLCALEVNVDDLRFRRFSASGIRGQINLDKQIITGRNLTFASMGGNVKMDARINASRKDSVLMAYDATFTKVDITRLFYEMENFDQTTLTDQNVKGIVSADVNFTSAWSNDLTINASSVKSAANIVIENGELIGFAPIQAVAKYIHVPDLNHVKFSTLKNTVSIAGRKIYIPTMDINSSAINISANGTHDFDNQVDYHLKLLLSDVLGKKSREYNTEFGEIEDDGLGRTSIFLSMKGPVEDPKFSYDRKAAGKKMRNDIAEEKKNLKSILKQELGLYKNEPSVNVTKPKKKEEMQIDWGAE